MKKIFQVKKWNWMTVALILAITVLLQLVLQCAVGYLTMNIWQDKTPPLETPEQIAQMTDEEWRELNSAIGMAERANQVEIPFFSEDSSWLNLEEFGKTPEDAVKGNKETYLATTSRLALWDIALNNVLPYVVIVVAALLFMLLNRRYETERAISVFPENIFGKIGMIAVLGLAFLIPLILLGVGLFHKAQIIIELKIAIVLLYYVFVYYVFGGFLLREVKAPKWMRIVLPTVLLIVCEGILFGAKMGIGNLLKSDLVGVSNWNILELLSYWRTEVLERLGAVYFDSWSTAESLDAWSYYNGIIKAMMAGIIALIVVSSAFTGLLYQTTRNMFVAVIPSIGLWNMVTFYLQKRTDLLLVLIGVYLVGMIAWGAVMAIRLLRSEEAGDSILLPMRTE